MRPNGSTEYLSVCYSYSAETKYREVTLYNSEMKKLDHCRLHILMANNFLIPTHVDLFADTPAFQYNDRLTAEDYKGSTSWDNTQIVDHVNSDPENNAVWNLRILPRSLNVAAKLGIQVLATLDGTTETKFFNSFTKAKRSLKSLSVRRNNREGLTTKNSFWSEEHPKAKVHWQFLNI
jgi:hypothetical protein